MMAANFLKGLNLKFKKEMRETGTKV